MNLLRRIIPKGLREFWKSEHPIEVLINGELLGFKEIDGQPTAKKNGIEARIYYNWMEEYDALTIELAIENKSNITVDDIVIHPLMMRFDVDPEKAVPRVRHMSGSYHYDACYPPRAFRVSEEAFMTHDHSKPVVIGGENAGEHSPILQFAISKDGVLSGFYSGFAWSGSWELSAGWKENSWSGEERGEFLVSGSMELGELAVPAGEVLRLPMVHIGFYEVFAWQDADNLQRRYIRECLSAKLQGERKLPVSYDHWFGIYDRFDANYLRQQADRAAELGCEYFCVDAAWYRTTGNFMDGFGNWDTPDPRRFPKGKKSMKELSDYVRKLGMGFGIWHLIQQAQPDSDALRSNKALFRKNIRYNPTMPGVQYSLRLETPEGVAYAKEKLSEIISDWDVTWTRYESIPEDGLAYNNGYNEVIDYLRYEFPDLYIEDCNGGGQRLDLNMTQRTHGNWLSDHTSSPEVCRFMQTGALRFWPVNYLNSAITAFKNRGIESASEHEILSRMVGVLSFNGAISEWTASQTAMMRECVDIYKRTRHLKDQPVFYPLPQPRNVDDWDIVLFGDGTGEGQLLFAFRVHGRETEIIDLLGSKKWEKIAGEQALLEQNGSQIKITLPPHGSGLWIR